MVNIWKLRQGWFTWNTHFFFILGCWSSTITQVWCHQMLKWFSWILYSPLCCWINWDATPTSNFQPIRLLDPCFWQTFTYLMTNSADPDQLASSGSALFAKTRHVVFSKRRVNTYLVGIYTCIYIYIHPLYQKPTVSNHLLFTFFFFLSSALFLAISACRCVYSSTRSRQDSRFSIGSQVSSSEP